MHNEEKYEANQDVRAQGDSGCSLRAISRHDDDEKPEASYEGCRLGDGRQCGTTKTSANLAEDVTDAEKCHGSRQQASRSHTAAELVAEGERH